MSAKNNKKHYDNQDLGGKNKSGITANASSLSSNNNFRKPNNDDDNLEQIKQNIGKTENESLASTQRALRMLNETYDIGADTAQELNRQGEKLDNMNSKLDDVNETLTSTQKNINNVKSKFGGLKNKLGLGKSLKVEKIKEKSMPKSQGTDKQKQQQQQPPVKAEFAKISGSDREVEINRNLEDMSLGLSRLTALAQDMSFELDRQNPIIDNMSSKVDVTNNRIDHQNSQMKKILK